MLVANWSRADGLPVGHGPERERGLELAANLILSPPDASLPQRGELDSQRRARTVHDINADQSAGEAEAFAAGGFGPRRGHVTSQPKRSVRHRARRSRRSHNTEGTSAQWLRPNRRHASPGDRESHEQRKTAALAQQGSLH